MTETRGYTVLSAVRARHSSRPHDSDSIELMAEKFVPSGEGVYSVFTTNGCHGCRSSPSCHAAIRRPAPTKAWTRVGRSLREDIAEAASDLGHARVIECTDPALATLLACDRTLRAPCRLIGERHLAVPLEHELKFRKRLTKLGYALPARHAATTT